MSNNKPGRPESKNVFYFPHYTKSIKELDLIEYRHKSEGYKAYYRLLEMVADADYHKLSIKSKDEKDMFKIGMNCNSEVVQDVIKILLNTGRIDRELWENENTIWMDDFVQTLKPVYSNRHKPLPQKEDNNRVSTSDNPISTGRNTQKRKEKKIKEKESREKDNSLLSFDEYQKQFPDKDVNKSLSKYVDYIDYPTHNGALGWQKMRRIKRSLSSGNHLLVALLLTAPSVVISKCPIMSGKLERVQVVAMWNI